MTTVSGRLQISVFFWDFDVFHCFPLNVLARESFVLFASVWLLSKSKSVQECVTTLPSNGQALKWMALEAYRQYSIIVIPRCSGEWS